MMLMMARTRFPLPLPVLGANLAKINSLSIPLIPHFEIA